MLFSYFTRLFKAELPMLKYFHCKKGGFLGLRPESRSENHHLAMIAFGALINQDRTGCILMYIQSQM